MNTNYLEQDNILYPDFNGNFDISTSILGKYGRMRLNYLKAEKPTLFIEYLQSGTLINHLQAVDYEATEMLIRLEEQYIKKNPLPKDDFMATVKARYQARDYAEEVVLDSLIFA